MRDGGRTVSAGVVASIQD
ncbi:MAG: hypothetical protein RIF42_00410 [Parvibaculaceae bacterium]